MRLALVRILKRILLLLGSLTLLVTLLPPTWYILWLAGPWGDPQGEVLIVLAGEGLDERMLGQNSYWRSVYAVWAWREGGFRHVLLSGDRGVTAPMREFLLSQGVPPAAVTVEERSQSTRENAMFAKAALGDLPGPYVLLTSDFHMFRAHRAFTRAGIAVRPRPIPDAGKRIGRWTARWQVFLDLGVETTKIAYYWARGWI